MSKKFIIQDSKNFEFDSFNNLREAEEVAFILAMTHEDQRFDIWNTHDPNSIEPISFALCDPDEDSRVYINGEISK